MQQIDLVMKKSAYRFDGIDDYISVEHNSSLVSPTISFCAWVDRRITKTTNRLSFGKRVVSIYWKVYT